MAARIAGCTPIIAIDINDTRLKLAAELGAHVTLNAASVNIVQAILAATAGRGVDFSVECTGRPDVLRQAIDALAACGTCALVRAAHPSTEVPLNMAAMLRGRSLRGVTEGDSVPQRFIPQLIDWWREGRFPFERLVQYFEFEQINEAVDGLCVRGGDQASREDAGVLTSILRIRCEVMLCPLSARSSRSTIANLTISSDSNELGPRLQ